MISANLHVSVALILVLSAFSIPIVHADFPFSCCWFTQSVLKIDNKNTKDRTQIPDESIVAIYNGCWKGNMSRFDEAYTKWERKETTDAEMQTVVDEAGKGLDFTSYQLISDYGGWGVKGLQSTN
jgi:hypothetical protein